jgi:N-hydroxyarylamine O-acetyltransferase
MNLDAYYKRIGFDGPAEVSLNVLKELHLLHPKSIPFENLNPFLGIPVKLDLESLHKKLIQDGRGGYCFEQNLLFKEVLQTMGFRVMGLAARVLWNRDETEITSRGHMLLLVEAEEKQYIADVGFGGLGTTAPLLLEPDIEQQTPHELYKIEESFGEYILRSFMKGEWKALYRFGMEEHFLQDYEVTNWYLSNHPESHFVTGLIAARPEIDPARRYALKGNQLSIHTLEEGTEKRTLNTADELKEVLENYFRIRLPDVPELNEKLAGIIESSDQQN